MNGESAKRIVGVSHIADYIKRTIAQSRTLATFRVRGEVSGLAEHSGRLYFDLKEHSDILKCIAWDTTAANLPPLHNGDEVILDGDFNTWAARSQYQLFVTAVELSGIGRLYAQFEALKRQFSAEGLFEPARKRRMPVFPRRLAIVSARGLGVEDFLTTMAQRAPHIHLTFVETRVQGDGAQIDIADAIDRASRLDVDTIVLTRGGGSYEDLFPFNLEPVVRAILRARHPVLTAIAHTGNRHLADDVADHVVETPSNAAHYFGSIRDEFLRRLERLGRSLDAGVRDAVRAGAQRFDSGAAGLQRVGSALTGARHQRLLLLERRLDSQTPVARLARRSESLLALGTRLDRFGRDLAKDTQRRLQVLTAQLDGRDPHGPLEAGYAMVYAGGRLVRDASSVGAGETIEAKLQHGTLTARVERVANDG